MAEHFNLSRLLQISLKISAIEADCEIWQSPQNHRKGGLIGFRGDYQLGSMGSDDARFIKWTIRQFIDLENVDGLVIDCTELTYEFGDDLSFSTLVPPRYQEIPTLVAVAPSCLDQYLYCVGKRDIRTSLEAALAEMDAHVRSLKSRI
jgi:hypothetical protein